MTTPPGTLRVLLSSAALLSAVSACAQVWAPLGEDYRKPAAGAEEQAVPGPSEAPDQLVLAQTLEERHPYVRFIRHGDGRISAFLTVPAGYATVMLDPAGPLLKYCSSFQRSEAPATLEVMAGGGPLFAGAPVPADLKATPWPASGLKTDPVEDLLIVQGTEEDLEEVFTFVDLFYNGGPQIEIQAQIVEVTGATLFERGVVPVDSTTPIISGLSGVGPRGEGSFLRNVGGGFPTGTNQNLAGTSGSGGVFQVSAIQNDLQFQAFIQLLQTEEDVDFVSQPSVVTRNGVTATMTSSEEFPFLEPTTIASTGVTAFKISYRQIGVQMHVLPFLLGGDAIHLSIHAEASRLGRNVLLGKDSAGNDVFSPTFTVRYAQTAVVVRSGDHVVIGGLTLTEQRDSTSKIPLLGDIPLLKYAFSSETTEEVKTEVFFIITPLVKSRATTISPLGDIFNPFSDEG